MKHQKKINIVEISNRHLPEIEYQKLDNSMKVDDSTYCFVASIYDDGVIIWNGFNSSATQDAEENTKNEFPYLYKLLADAFLEDIRYIDFFDFGDKLPNYEHFEW